MKQLSPRLLSQIRKVAQQIPLSVLTTVAALIAEVSQAVNSETVWRPLLQQMPKPIWRQLLTDLITIWYEDNPTVQGESIATALLSAHHCIERA